MKNYLTKLKLRKQHKNYLMELQLRMQHKKYQNKDTPRMQRTTSGQSRIRLSCSLQGAD